MSKGMSPSISPETVVIHRKEIGLTDGKVHRNDESPQLLVGKILDLVEENMATPRDLGRDRVREFANDPDNLIDNIKNHLQSCGVNLEIRGEGKLMKKAKRVGVSRRGR